jgi:ribosomal protein L12E/L44/L45/RPP1/RPP2
MTEISSFEARTPPSVASPASAAQLKKAWQDAREQEKEARRQVEEQPSQAEAHMICGRHKHPETYF